MYEWRVGNRNVNYKCRSSSGSSDRIIYHFSLFFIYHFLFEHLWTEKSPFQGYFQHKSYTRLDVRLSAEMTK